MTEVDDKAEVLSRVCDALGMGDEAGAAKLVRSEYPFEPIQPARRSYNELQSARVFFRDGFIDRYSGQRLFFPAALRLIAEKLPREFPWHPHGRMTKAHIAFWEFSPTVDHLVPVARGGLDKESNWVTTSMVRNAAKAHWTLEELGWELHPAGKIGDWDGQLGWFLRMVEADPTVLENSFLRRWHRAGFQVVQQCHR